MKISVEGYIKELDDILAECSNYIFFVRATELQLRTVNLLTQSLKQINEVKEHFISQQQESISNTLFTYELYFESVLFQINMVLELKNNEPSKAWEYLVKSQVSAQAALRIGFRNEEILMQHSQKLLMDEKTYFPPQLFVSAGFMIHGSKCSICQDEYELCNHIRGMAYMGEMCSEILNHAELVEVSVVENPADKMCRATTVTIDGKLYDAFSLREKR